MVYSPQWPQNGQYRQGDYASANGYWIIMRNIARGRKIRPAAG